MNKCIGLGVLCKPRKQEQSRPESSERRADEDDELQEKGEDVIKKQKEETEELLRNQKVEMDRLAERIGVIRRNLRLGVGSESEVSSGNKMLTIPLHPAAGEAVGVHGSTGSVVVDDGDGDEEQQVPSSSSNSREPEATLKVGPN
uniref:Uncharacterized protein n=1 Tax=Kalanchoe fedtschenkoi TaxID=63787 RepID=A0A7N0TVN2_KALFE